MPGHRVKDEVISHTVYTVKQPHTETPQPQDIRTLHVNQRKDNMETHRTLSPTHFVHLTDICAEVMLLSKRTTLSFFSSTE